MMMIWRHYILIYYKIKEERYYETLYGKPRKRKKTAEESQTSGLKTLGLGDTLQFTEDPMTLVATTKEKSSALPQEDNFASINIKFFTEELFYYLMEVLHSTAAMAYS